MQQVISKQPQDVLRDVFGYEQFRPYQHEAVVRVCAGRSVLVVLPTGGGKSLVYQVPALVRDGVALVFSPLISLMRDQVDALRAVGVRAAFLNSTLTGDQRDAVVAAALRGELDLLYIAPEGFFGDRFQELLRLRMRVALIAIDEAHCISEWGHEFRPEYRQLRMVREQFPGVPIVACTATATEQVRADIVQQLCISDMETIVGSFERENLTLHMVPKHDVTAQVAEVIARHRGMAGIVYAATRKRVEELSDALNARGCSTLPYHAGMDAGTRERNQQAFANDAVDTMVATVAFGMGIDKSNIRYVVHANLPKSIEGYYQEVGRAGRDGLPSECVAFTSNGDIATQQYLIDQAESEEERARAKRQLDHVVRFARTMECRHAAILRYFGEERSGWTCGERCDVCLAGDIQERDATTDVQQVLSAVARIERGGFPVGALRIAQVLGGSSVKEVARFEQLPTFGGMRDRTQAAIRDIIGFCIDRGLLTQEAGKYPVLRLGAGAAAVLRGEERVLVKERRAQAVEQVTAYEQTLFDELRQWRAGVAQRDGVPPYVICSDKVLTDLATYLPATAEDLLRISGIGAHRAERFGAALLGAIRRHMEAHGVPSRMGMLLATAKEPRRSKKVSAGSDTVTATFALYEQGWSVERIAQHRELSEQTIVSHLAQCVQDGRLPLAAVRAFVSEEREHAIRQAFVRAGSLDALGPIKRALPPDYTYVEIHFVRAVLFRDGQDAVVVQ
ncbi:MAG: DNA helicase RecQ [bacterium]|nr:DNA helicase RecQ [bacterium]